MQEHVHRVRMPGATPDLRAALSEHLLRHADTAFLISNVREFLAKWEQITAVERQMVSQLLSSDRSDRRWIRAVTLTRPNVPEELVAPILSVQHLSEATAEELVQKMSSEMIGNCLAVYCGAHRRLYYLGINLPTQAPWHQLLEHFVQQPNSPYFQFALNVMLSAAMNGDRAWKSPSLWKGLCGAADASLRQELFRALLNWTIRINGAQCRVSWWIFFKAVKDESELSSYVDELVANVETIEGNTDNLFRVFGRKIFAEMLKHLRSDNIVLSSLAQLERLGGGTPLTRSTFELIGDLYRKNPPRLMRTHERMQSLLDKTPEQKLREIVEQARLHTIKIASEQRNKVPDHEVELSGWVSSKVE